MFSSVYSFSSRGWEREIERSERRPSVAVNSSHLSPGLSFNCSALPAGSSLLWSNATLFFNAFHESHFAKQLLWGFLCWGSNLINDSSVNARLFLALAEHNIAQMLLSHRHTLASKVLSKLFFVYLLKSRFWGFDSQRGKIISDFGRSHNPCIFYLSGKIELRLVWSLV